MRKNGVVMTTDITYTGVSAGPQKNRIKKLNRYFKNSAKRTLFAGDNYHNAVIAPLICGMFSGGLLYLSFYVPDLIGEALAAAMNERAAALLTSTLDVIVYTVTAFLFFMFFSGVYVMCSRMKEEPDSRPGVESYSSFSDLFMPMSGGNFSKYLVIFLILAVQLCAVIVPCVFICRGVGGIGIPAFAVFFVRLAATCACAFMCIMFFALLLPLPYVFEHEDDVPAVTAYKKSASAALPGVFRCCGLLFSFIPLLLLSVLSFGVLFFAYALPYMTLSAAKAGEYLYMIANTERNV